VPSVPDRATTIADQAECYVRAAGELAGCLVAIFRWWRNEISIAEAVHDVGHHQREALRAIFAGGIE
jgi:hypothetical protein